MIKFFKKKKKIQKDNQRKIVGRTNIVQYDSMGYPLRLCLLANKEMIWLDSEHQEDDLECKWIFLED